MILELSILIAASLLALTIFLGLLYFGIFQDINVSVGQSPYHFGGRTIAYKRAKGKYSESGSMFTETLNDVPKLNLIGIYYDDPEKVKDANKCRFIVGAVLSREETLLSAETELLTQKGYHFGQLPDVDHVVHTSFPYKGVVSVIIAIRRVYPIIKSYIKEHNLCAHPAIEIYSGDSIYFIWPLAKQDLFHQFHDEVDDDEDTDESNEERADDADKDETKGSVKGSIRGSKRSSTSSSFEELHADENGKDE